VNKFTNTVSSAVARTQLIHVHAQQDAPQLDYRRLSHMRLTHVNGLMLLASAVILTACGGGDTADAGATSGATAGAATTTPPAGQPGAGGAAAGGAQPATGQTHTVRMVGDAQGYRFEPANITVKQGDAVKWVMVSGGPHNVAFDANGIPAGAQTQLSANMPNQQGPLSSPMMMNANEEYTVSFAGVPAGAYNYICTPHLAMNMKGVVTVQ
jgi:plastocyanin